MANFRLIPFGRASAGLIAVPFTFLDSFALWAIVRWVQGCFDISMRA
jgi:hypothetical protein